MEQKILDIIQRVAEVNVLENGNSTVLESIGWDSLSNLAFIAEIDNAFGLTLSIEKLTSAITISDLIDLVERSLE